MKAKMETVIKRLIKLAEDYKDFGIVIGLKQSHNDLRESPKIGIYFASEYRTYSVTFDKIEITDYAKKVQIPYGMTAIELNKIYKEHYDYLHNNLIKNEDEVRMQGLRARSKEIKDMEKALRKLKRLES